MRKSGIGLGFAIAPSALGSLVPATVHRHTLVFDSLPHFLKTTRELGRVALFLGQGIRGRLKW